jgi:uncharacterized protein YajQ (UPF0234 family)
MQLSIPDVKVLTPRRFGDNRGWFTESWSRKVLDVDFCQDNLSLSAPRGTVRGLHFQKPPHAQAKLVSVLRGRIFDVAVDIRVGSPTYGQHVAVELSAATEERVAAALEVFRDKLVKRQISLKSLTASDPRASGKEYKISCTFAAGISQEQAKKLGKIIRDEGPKSVKTQVMGEELRVTSKSRDDLQEVQALVRGADLDFAVQFVNYR